VGRVHAVQDVSLSLRKGETLSLVGESGSGKSTTGRAVLQLIPALSGQVLLDGEEVSLLSPKAFLPKRRKIQMIFQDPMASLDPRVAIGQTIAEPILVHKLAGRKEALRKAGDLLEKVGLGGHMLDRYPHELSGGQRQRVCIARALSLDPKVIVADEAVSALDVSVRAQVINLMMDLQDQLDIAYLFISHDMAVVERISHRVAVMYRGEIVEIGARNRIFSDPQHPYTKQLLAAVPVPDPARRAERRRRLVAEMRDPYHPVGYVPPVRSYRQSGEDHYVQEWGDEWASLPVEVAR
jgi:peptide/nickel transport system ATP-binding protein